MGANWQTDKAKTDRVLPAVKRILGEYLISAAPFEEDAERNTDLIVLRLQAVRIGVRIRDSRYWLQNSDYREQFTIRSGRPNGVKTELAKIITGWGDYFFYGFADHNYQGLLAYILGDLNVFRLWYSRQLARLPANQTPGEHRNNPDGSSSFCAFRISDLPDNFIVARGVPIDTTKHDTVLRRANLVSPHIPEAA